jgi:hypothetical protein
MRWILVLAVLVVVLCGVSSQPSADAAVAGAPCPPGLERQGRCKTPTPTGIPTVTLQATAVVTPQSAATPSPTSTPILTLTPTATVTPMDPCAESLQSRIDRTPSGGTLDLPACTFREQITVQSPIRIDGHSQAEVRGSDVWTEWSGRTSVKTVPPFTTGQIASQFNVPTCSDGTHTTCNRPEQVWLDGRWLRHVGTATPGTGEFALDGSRHVILGDDPTGHTVEVATRWLWLDAANSTDVTIYGVTFRHTAGSYQDSAMQVAGSKRLTLQHDSFFEAAYNAVSGADSDGMQVLGNEISWNGALGVANARATNFTLREGTIQYNNRRLLYGQAQSDYGYGWEAAGAKLYASSGTVSGIHVLDNGGPGLWCDGGCTAYTWSGNESARNLNNGFEWEGSSGPFTITLNTSSNNRGCGIMVALNQYAVTGIGQVSSNTGSGNGRPFICKGYDNTEVQPGVVYVNNPGG